MTFDPGILGLYASSFLMGTVVLFASIHAWQILRRWDPASGSELQLRLERRTYLISTLLGCFFVFELSSFFLYILTVERLHPFFVGAMCAAGSLNANSYGYPALFLKLGNFLLAGLWLILNHVDNSASDYPLIRIKYGALLFLAPLIMIETGVQAAYFLHLRPEIITSCCGTLFSTESSVMARESGSASSAAAVPVFFAALALTTFSGVRFLFRGKGASFFSGTAVFAFIASIWSLLSFISAYVYELPTHHCPFCFLKKEYAYSGYLFYAAVLGGGLTGAGVGILAPFTAKRSLIEMLPSIRRKLAAASLVCFLSVAVFTIYIMITSNLVLD